jgi:hypothetical protein
MLDVSEVLPPHHMRALNINCQLCHTFHATYSGNNNNADKIIEINAAKKLIIS